MRKLKGIILVVLLVASVLMPFNIYAETINNHVSGINVWTDRLESQSFSYSNTTYWINTCNVHINFELDGEYLGWVNLGIYVSFRNYFYAAQTPSWGDLASNWSGNYYINGSSFEIIVPIQFNSSNSPYYQGGGNYHLPNSSSDITVSYSNQGNVTPYGEIESLEQIIDILSDIYNSQDQVEGILNNQLTELQNVVSALGLSNQYLETLSKLRQWNFPIESLSIVYYFYKFYNLDLNDVFNYGYYNYPIFSIDSSFSLRSKWSNGNLNNLYDQIFIFAIDKNIFDLNSFSSVFSVSNGSILSVVEINRIFYLGNGFSIVKVNIDSSGSNYFTINSLVSANIIPIYFDYSKNNNLSTDFALIYGLSNNLLNNLNIIVNGTSISQSSVSDVNSQNQLFEYDRDDLIEIEDNFNEDMNDKLDVIDTNTGVSGFGGYFMNSAVWVRSQFDRLTNNTPYGSLIVYGMTLGLALLLLGKVFL